MGAVEISKWSCSMIRYKAIALLLILVPALGIAQQKTKKHNDVPAVFQNARFVYVEAVDGEVMKPGLYPADRQAIFDVEDSLRDWNRYSLANRRADADLVLVVRKGRLASAQARAGVSVGPPRLPGGGNPASGRPPGQAGQGGDGESVGAEGEVGPENDMLRVYLVSDGKLTGPVWTREIQDGLDAPPVLLMQQLRTAVERAYPSQPPAAKQPTP
jgi:hypothetical protein